MKLEDYRGCGYETPKGGYLKVVGVTRHKGKRILKMHCSLCSEDEELWGDLKIDSSLFKKESICCGCSKTPRYTSQQNKLRVQRYCEEEDLNFKGFSEENVKSKTKVHIVCEEGHDSYPEVTALLNQNPRCGTCYLQKLSDRGGRSTDQDEVHIKSFVSTGAYVVGTVFKRNSDYRDSQGKFSHWYVTCPICKEDGFSKELNSPYKFSCHVSGLKRGTLCCRCGTNYIYSEEEQAYRVTKKLSARGLIFEGFEGKYVNSSSRLKYSCTKGHTVFISINGVVNKSTQGCGKCNGLYGHYPDREEEKDYLYITQFSGDYIKTGRSFEPCRRSGELIDKSGITDLNVLHVFTGTHKEVFETEQKVHHILEERGYYHKESTWTIETFHKESYLEGLEIVKSEGLIEIDKTYVQDFINEYNKGEQQC